METKRTRRPVVIGVAIVAAVAVAAGGRLGYRAYEDHRTAMARGTCVSAAADLDRAAKECRNLLGADATKSALRTDANAIKDAKTLDALKKVSAAAMPETVKCDASKTVDLDATATKAGKAAKMVKTDTAALKSAVKAVETSKLDKTVADADALYKATDGKVADNKTREELAKAVKSRDAGAIVKAMKSVNGSKAAKEKADAEAKAKTEQEAAAQAQAAQSTSNGGGMAWTGGNTQANGGGASQRTAQTPTYQAPQQTQQPAQTQQPSNGGGQPYIPPTASCTAPITGACSTPPGGEVWW